MTTPRPKLPGLVQQYVTQGDRGLKEWHLLLRRVTFGAALVLMAASVVSLHYACALIGLPDVVYAPVAWIVPLAMELGMAAVASSATTIRKPARPGEEDKPGRYYWSLWVIFSFMMSLAQAANIGHAAVVVSDRMKELPSFFPATGVYVFACTFAALFPLGGTLLVHVSGFLRAHGAGARWIEEDTEIVYVEATPHAQPARAARAAAPARDRAAAPAQPARTPEPVHERAPEQVRTDVHTSSAGATDVSSGEAAQPKPTTGPRHSTPEQQAARAVYDRLVAAAPDSKPDAKQIQREAGLEHRDPATVRRWVQRWWQDEQMPRVATETIPPVPAEPAVAQDAELPATGNSPVPETPAVPTATEAADTRNPEPAVEDLTDAELDALTTPDLSEASDKVPAAASTEHSEIDSPAADSTAAA